MIVKGVNKNNFIQIFFWNCFFAAKFKCNYSRNIIYKGDSNKRVLQPRGGNSLSHNNFYFVLAIAENCILILK